LFKGDNLDITKNI